MGKVLSVNLNDKNEPTITFGDEFTFGLGLEIGVRLINFCQEEIEKDLPVDKRKTSEEFLSFILSRAKGISKCMKN